MHDINLDVTHSEALRLQHDGMEYAPDVLILPSKLKQFSKVCLCYLHEIICSSGVQVIQSSLVVNPSFASKGMYATLSLDPGTGHLKDRLKAEPKRVDGA